MSGNNQVNINIVDILNEYKTLYETVKRDNDKYLQLTLSMREILDVMKDTIKNLQEDNQNLRTHLSIINHRLIRHQERELENVTAYIDIIEEKEDMEDQKEEEIERIRVRIPTYSIPPHIRRAYLENMTEQQCSICLSRVENNDTIELTECGHLFHLNCLRRHRLNNNNCPVCRNVLN